MGYADDLQLYDHSLAAEVTSLASRMSSCIVDVGAWMASNRLPAQPTKTELILLGSPRRVVNIKLGSVRIDEAEIPLSPLVRDLGVYIDISLSLQDHVDKTVPLAFFHLRQLRLIRRSPPQDAMHSLVRALIHSRLDYATASWPTHQVACSDSFSRFSELQRVWSCVFQLDRKYRTSCTRNSTGLTSTNE